MNQSNKTRHQQCTVRKTQNDAYYDIVVATVLVWVSFCVETNITIYECGKKNTKSSKFPWTYLNYFSIIYLLASIAWIPTQKLYVYQHFENYAIWYHAYQWNSYTKLGLPVYRQGRIFVFYKWTYLAFSLLKRFYNSVSLSTKRLPKI